MNKIKKMKTQRLWNQKGCSSKLQKGGSGCGCGVLTGGRKMRGGSGCAMCSAQTGGSHLPSLPPALVGSPWTPSISNWPGVAGQDGVTNHFSMNNYPVDPQTQTIQERAGSLFLANSYVGGKKYKKKHCTKRNKKGGMSLIPQDLLNFGRTFTYGLGSAYDALNGYQQRVSPLPYKDQLR